MRKKLTISVLIAAFIALIQLNSNANGPLVIKGGMAITYDDRPLLYRYDKGPCGSLSNQEYIDLVEALFSDWENVPTSDFTFKQDTPGTLDVDVDETNFDPILNSSDLLGYTPVICDHTGELLDSFLGSGAGNSVLGLAGPITVSSGPLVNEIAESQAIFNGMFINGIDTPGDPESSLDAFKGTVIHEFGHGFGLDHTQINLEAIKGGATQQIRDSVPLLFPVAVNDLFEIRRDDTSGVSFLYPDQSMLGGVGTIEGAVLRSNGVTTVSGANVIARNINDPLNEAISCVSDFLDNGTGSFTLFAVPPGDYRVEIEPIDLSFTGGSGVGPFTTSKTDESFVDPVPKGFYTGPNMAITTSESEALIVSVAAGQTVDNVNIVASTSLTTSGGTTSGTLAQINEAEPNDSVDTAQVVSPPVKISGNASFTDDGEIELSSDTGSSVIISDLFKFTIGSSTTVNSLLTIESSSDENDLDLVLLDGAATEIIDTSSQTGNVDELISKSLKKGTYLLGVGAFSGTAPYELEITLSSSGGGTPILTLSAPESLILKAFGRNNVTVTANASSFSGKSICKVLPPTSDSGITTKVKPKKFILSGNKTTKNFMVKIPISEAINLINNNTTETITVNVTCNNGANDEIDITLSPTSDSVIERTRNYRYILKKE